ncbi:acylneuraminate cytidylyltransferase family protein [Arenicellales bacterium IMCC57338]
MFNNYSVLAIVPARGGSKRVLSKNKRLIGGSPLISWTIQACRDCKYIDRIVVSTDDPDIAQISRNSGADLVLNRPAGLSTDSSPVMDTVTQIITDLKAKGESYDFVFLGQPTSPLRTSAHIYSAFDLIKNNINASVVGVTESGHPKEWQGPIDDDGKMQNFLQITRLDISSNILPVNYVINGAIYISPTSTLLKERTFFPNENLNAFFMPRRDSIDIDTEFDFEIADYLLSEKHLTP